MDGIGLNIYCEIAALFLIFFTVMKQTSSWKSIYTHTHTCWQANRTGPVAKPSLRSVAEGFPNWLALDVKSSTSSTNYETGRSCEKLKTANIVQWLQVYYTSDYVCGCAGKTRNSRTLVPEMRFQRCDHTGRLFHGFRGQSLPEWIPWTEQNRTVCQHTPGGYRLKKVGDFLMCLYLCGDRTYILLYSCLR